MIGLQRVCGFTRQLLWAAPKGESVSARPKVDSYGRNSLDGRRTAAALPGDSRGSGVPALRGRLDGGRTAVYRRCSGGDRVRGTRGSPERVDPDGSLLSPPHWGTSACPRVSGPLSYTRSGLAGGLRSHRDGARNPQRSAITRTCKKSAAAAWAWSTRPGTTGCGEPKRSR